MQAFQEVEHAASHDYRESSPHLKHWKLYDALVAIVRSALFDARASGASAHLLDVGAGEGAFTEPVLSAGFRVTAVEMSRPSLETLQDRYGQNPGFSAYFDPDGSLSVLANQRYGAILYTAVLHHIPDYLTAIDNAVTAHLEQGGWFVSLQDPLWYPGVTRFTRFLTQLSYYWWRVLQGNYVRGLQTRLRRARGVFYESNPADMSEYHVVRNGVDQDAIISLLNEKFEKVTLIPYWSAHSGIWQRVGSWLGLKNTFGLVAEGYRG